jgi:hypothetical protein
MVVIELIYVLDYWGSESTKVQSYKSVLFVRCTICLLLFWSMHKTPKTPTEYILVSTEQSFFLFF